jgi:hypothetical protein
MTHFLQIAGVLFIVAVVIGLIAGEEDRPDFHGHAVTAAVTSPLVSKAPSASEQMQTMMPADEVAVIAAVEKARQQYAAATNDLAKGASRPARATAICAALRSRSVAGWVGRVSTLSSNADGKGVLAIEIAPNVLIKTWNNGLSDTWDQTLIEPSSPLFAVASQLHKGQIVRVGGTFFQNASDCVHEASMSLADSIDEPEFIFRFGSITAIQ